MRAGLVAVIGKPNVGKSTLVNFIVGQKVSIVSNKPQTTRRRVMGIANGDDYQICFLDTPGLHEPHTKLGRSMIEQARSALSGIDLILYVADGSRFPGEQDERIATQLHADKDHPPILLCMNKMDMLKAENVARNVERYQELFAPEDYMMTTAIRGHNVPKLIEMIVARLPEQERLYPEDEYTDQSARFMAAEFVREKILVATRQEIPHATAVQVDSWEEAEDRPLVKIHATILIERDSQRAILLGKRGEFIKKVGTSARKEIEEMLGMQVFLDLHVRVREDWRQNPTILHELEYTD